MYSSVLFVLLLLCGAWASQKPHVLFVIVDDLGWNDVSFHHNSDFSTPYIDTLASEGVILDNYYVQPLCSPSRTAFMTGRYPYHLGTADMVITNGYNMSIPIGETTIAEKMKENGYSTHMAGKWDCGMTSWAETPTSRGFDTFYGYYGAQEDHYTRSIASGLYTGTDFRDGTTADNSTNGVYSSDLYTQRIIDIINAKANDSVPLYLYLAYQAIHVPLEVDAQYLATCGNITDTNRRIVCGMAQSVDQGLRRVVTALSNNNMLNNTLIVFTADNGADTSSGGNNWPLRGCKGDVYEGGVRAAAWVWGRMLQGGRTEENLMHITDWLPTLMDAVGGNHNTNKPLDGVSQWSSLVKAGTTAARTELLLQLNPVGLDMPVEQAAYRYGNWKLIHGQPSTIYGYCVPGTRVPLPPSQPAPPPVPPADLTWLFDLSVDPYETNNVALQHEDIVSLISQKLQVYRNENIVQQPHTFDPASDPSKFGGFWTPWANN